MTLHIIPSGKPKIWDLQPHAGAVPASQAYTGTFHRLCQKYVRMLGVKWVIISPKYGMLEPEDLVEGTYDLSFRMKRNKNVISIEEMRNQLEKKELLHASEVAMIGGQKFKPIIETLFPKAVLRFPLHGASGIGVMQRMLKEAIEEGREL